jgi:hypothetical protein
VPGDSARLKLPSGAVVALAVGVPVRLAEVNTYTSPAAGLLVPGAGPPARCNVPVTVPFPADAVGVLTRGLDDEHPEEQTRRRMNPTETHTVCFVVNVIATTRL